MNTRLQSAFFESALAVRDYLLPLRALGKKVVTTNGCFDIIHAGHIQYLYEAAAFGDLLVVGINSDHSVKRLKGPTRPLQNERDRANIMGSLRMVSAAFIFPEDNPCAFVEIIRPDFHVKGGDYEVDMIETPVVRKYGGEVKIVSLLKGASTTGIINRM